MCPMSLWILGDGVPWCLGWGWWREGASKLFLPHFRAAGCTKYALEALWLQMQANVTLSPNLAHQVTWNRFVNVSGKNIPCDLHNEHVGQSDEVHHSEHGVQSNWDIPSEICLLCYHSTPDMRNLMYSLVYHTEPLHTPPNQTLRM